MSRWMDETRRAFLRKLGIGTAGAGAIASGGLLGPLLEGHRGGEGRSAAGASGPLIRDGSATRPVAISSANGLPATERALAALEEGHDTLEAVVSGVNIVESDPEDMTVGYGGLPNHLGEVQLDSQVWHGPTRGAGAVAALEGFPNPSRVAVAVMRYTDHVLLVGGGAARFAREFGFEEKDLLTDAARRRWLRWRARASEDDDYLSPEQSGEPIRDFEDPGGPVGDEEGGEGGSARSADDADRELVGGPDGSRPWGTIHCSVVNAAGEISGVTTTSGLFFKVPGRVGDSPLPGCGCYVDNDVGAAGGTGRGEAVIKTLGAKTIVEEMRRGAHPTDAALTALRRIADWTVEDRLLDERGRPNFGVRYYALDKQGETGSATMWSGGQHAVNDGRENRLVDSAYLFERSE